MNRAIIALTAIAMVVGCAKDEATESWASDSVAQFTTESAITRVATSTSTTTASTWEGGEYIGISSVNYDSNVKYVASIGIDSKVTFAAYNADDTILLPRITEETYSAYYPWQEGTKYTSNVADQDPLGDIDFLVAGGVTGKEGGDPVSFTFVHKLSMLKFEITLEAELKALYPDYATNLSDYLTELTIEDAVTEATYSFDGTYASTVATGDITVPVSVETGDYSDSNPATAYAILNPTGASVTMNLVLLFADKIYKRSFSLNAQQSKIHTYNVTIGYKEIKVYSESSSEGIKDWGVGNETAEQLDKTTEIKEGTVNKPFEISTVEQLALIGSGQTPSGSTEPWDPSAHYKLIADIGNSSGDPITIEPAISESNPFFGELNGNDCTITNVNFATTDDSSYAGLIPYVSANAKIHDLTLVGCKVSAASTSGYVGLIAGHNDGTIENCTVSGTVNNNANSDTGCGTGGIVGHNKGIVDRCVSSVAVEGNWKVGGIVGYLDSGYVVNCGNTGSVTNNYDDGSYAYQQGTGGIAGMADSSTYILNCYNTGTITTNGYQSGGGIAGYTNQGKIRSCYNVGSVVDGNSDTDTDTNLGGVVGRTYSANNVVDCYYLEGSCSVGIGLINDSSVDPTVSMIDANMKLDSFIDDLNTAATTAQTSYTSVTLYEWISGDDYPVIGTDKIAD